MSAKRIWALLDERQGNSSQTLGVAEALRVPFEIKNIRFNEWIRLPNFLINSNRLGFTKATVGELSPPWPDITIGTARRLGIAASYIKSRNPSTFIAQIQWPGTPYKQFDFIAAPLHDEAPQTPGIITTLGAPHRVTPDILQKKAEQWRPSFAHLPAPLIAVLVGGTARSREFGAKQAAHLGEIASAFAHSLGGSLLVTTSRRTGKETTDALAAHLTCPHYFHRWNDEDPPEANPFYGFLGVADAIIATGESVSMCSEACATGKPLYVYVTDGLISPKQQKFLDVLYSRKLADPLRKDNRLFSPPSKLDDASLIAAEIRKRAGL